MLVANTYTCRRRPGTLGFPLPRVVGREGGTAGIQVRVPNVIRSYLDKPEATAAAFTADGWFCTGDLGEFDEDGYLRISGRAKELIITGGYNVYPREVEEVLRAHPGVADAAVVGFPSEAWGETVAAFLVPAQSGEEKALLSAVESWCEERLVAYKRPREWRIVDEVPRNALGKILRHQRVPQAGGRRPPPLSGECRRAGN